MTVNYGDDKRMINLWGPCHDTTLFCLSERIRGRLSAAGAERSSASQGPALPRLLGDALINRSIGEVSLAATKLKTGGWWRFF